MPVFPRDRGFGKREKPKVNHFLRGTLSPSGTSPISFCREHRGVLVAQSDWKYTKYTRVALKTYGWMRPCHAVLLESNIMLPSCIGDFILRLHLFGFACCFNTTGQGKFKGF